MPTPLRTTLFILAGVAALPLAAQNFGEITGAVSDPTGAVIARSVVTVTHTGTNQVRRVATNETGNYSVPFLVPGLYDVRAESPSFNLKTAVEKSGGVVSSCYGGPWPRIKRLASVTQ